MNRTLVLNASYEPIAVVSSRRAFLLVMNDKASVLSQSDRVLRSATVTAFEPSVVLLRQFIRIPRRSIPLSRRAVLEMYDYTCAYCFKYGNTLDHVLPRARGGTNTWDNVVVACVKCNNKKADRLLSELGWKLPFELRNPEPTAAAIIGKRWKEPAWTEFTAPWQRHELKMAV
ncbi:HNH endonuclease [Frondihabitans sucicola]|uniref:HNH endonuclease n=1 Tax=Frondihabitans sucicola TaxID=1268041 RepID=A0ABM8GLM9_9MICO|nr:HNH endonuclease [Frondihabitans sucicola]BDZ49323.1 HNH endonuclease [Frondihabitans sucicola]